MNPNPIRISRRALVREDTCVACGCCAKVCPRGAIQILRGITARVNRAPVHRLRQMRAGVSRQRHHMGGNRRMKKHWYDYLWIVSLAYLCLGFFNILFAWLGLACFFIPLIMAAAGGTKGYCNRYCGPGTALFPAGRGASVFPAGGTSPPG